MKRPLASTTPIDTKRINRWTNTFSTYRGGLTKAEIAAWLDQFEGDDRPAAARVLDAVEYYGRATISSGYKDILGAMPGWHHTKAKRQGEWRFCALSSSAGESGDAMLHQFRVSNRLDSKRYDELFITKAEILRAKLTLNDTIVFVDDISGTGDQVCRAWTEPSIGMQMLLAGIGNIHLILIAATEKAKKRIAKETDFRPTTLRTLTEKDNIFSDECVHFSKNEKQILLKYCHLADQQNPKGYGNCGLLVVFEHRAPNNSIPILHATTEAWSGLFPRH